MAHEFNGTSQYLKSSATISPLTAYSYHVWFRTDHVPATGGGTTRRVVVGINNIDFAYDIGILWDDANASYYRTAYHHESGGTYQFAQLAAGPSANTWHSLTVTYDGANVKFYVDGAESASTAAAAPTNAVNPDIFVAAYRPGIEASYMNGQIAEFALWSATLTAGEVTALAKGIVPIAIRLGSLAAYWPLLRDMVSYRGPTINTATQGTVYTHPPILMTDHGIDSMRFTNVATPTSVSASWSSSMTLDSEPPLVIQQLGNAAVFSSTITPPERFDRLTSAARILSVFRPRGVELSTRRSRGYTSR